MPPNSERQPSCHRPVRAHQPLPPCHLPIVPPPPAPPAHLPELQLYANEPHERNARSPPTPTTEPPRTVHIIHIQVNGSNRLEHGESTVRYTQPSCACRGL
ncbi:hypothetical protein SCOCK_690007 [Actinacidiphila cocklensis]|uniref:Uncharacterized protein n=1 Tax=Actinacidiphila cocklensis TaxID=887465 RepID=A0A9W4GX14_9ACTN|nr:hypothetical protein SCOCK_690007 [Actinacidiphila cocklensis]